MITEYPLEHRRYDQSEYEPFWAAAAALDLPESESRRMARNECGVDDAPERVGRPVRVESRCDAVAVGRTYL
jgi:hypothetical protein